MAVQRGQANMLIAMLTMYLLGGGLLGGSVLTPADVDRIGERMELVLNDPSSLEASMLVLDELKIEVENFNEVFLDSGDTLPDLYLDHGADSKQILGTLEALNLEWGATQNRSIELRYRLKESVTADEWVVVFGT